MDVFSSVLGRFSRRSLWQIGTAAVLCCIAATNVSAREIGIAFIEDGVGEPAPRLSSQIVQELQSLLGSEHTIAPQFLETDDTDPNLLDLMQRATSSASVEYIVATGFIGSQEMYQASRYSKPTWLLRVLDPNLTGAPTRDNVKNLRSYSSVNEIVDVFERVSALFKAKRVGIILPGAAVDAQRNIGGAVAAAAKSTGIEAQFISLDSGFDAEVQLIDIDAVVLPPVTISEQQRDSLLQTLLRKKIPSFAVGGDRMVLNGALISDTLDEDNRVLARRVALDLQLAIYGESRTIGMRRLEPKKRTTVNIDTARALGIDFDLDEILTARIVRGNNNTLKLGFLSALEQATDRNLDLRGQFEQLNIDKESLEQARAAKRPQVSAQVTGTLRGEQLPERDTLASVRLSQTIYSPTANAEVDVAELGLVVSEKSLLQKQLDIVQQTSAAYFQALQTQAQFETNLRDLTLNRENLGLARQRKRSGSGTGAEIYRWQAIIAASENAVLRAYTANTSAQSQLARLLNLRLQIPTTLADVDLDQPPFDLLHEGLEPYLKSTGKADRLRAASAARSLANSPQLDSAQANIEIFDTSLRALKKSYYTPELSITGQYSRFLEGTVNSAGIDVDGLDDWSVMLTAELPLWLGGQRRSLIRQYTAQSELADTQLQSARLALWTSAGDAVNNLITNFRSISLSNQAEAAALKSQKITQNAYRLGAASVTELQDTQNEYREAQDNAQIARYQYLTALVDFQALMGEMPMLESGARQFEWLQAFKRSMEQDTLPTEMVK